MHRFQNIINEVERTEYEKMILEDVSELNDCDHESDYVNWFYCVFYDCVPFPCEEIDRETINELERILIKFIKNNDIDYFNITCGMYYEEFNIYRLNKLNEHLDIANNLKHFEIADIIKNKIINNVNKRTK